MSESGFPFSSERIFTLSEANALVPELEQHWTSIKQGRQILIDTREEVKKASAQASSGGGTVVGVKYIKGLQDINGRSSKMWKSASVISLLCLMINSFFYAGNLEKTRYVGGTTLTAAIQTDNP
jgi:hypothetical protein